MAKKNALDRIWQDYPHLRFVRCWNVLDNVSRKLGQCESLSRCLGDLPIDPDVQHQMRRVSFERGAVATTAIEGNTLTEAELRLRLEGKELPESRQYQGTEVMNVLNLMHEVHNNVVNKGYSEPISPSMICDFNRQIGKDLGPLYDGVPGRTRRDSRHVGSYLAPPCEYVDDLLSEYCDWLRREFQFHSGKQAFADAIIQAIVAHVFFEWIHPFADGNGRTGRMIEFYVLLRAGMPDVAAHILANHYSKTRSEYTAHFDRARKSRDLTEFVAYAVTGLIDGLWDSWNLIQASTFKVCWEAYVYRVFASYDNYHKRSIFKRRRNLALAMPIGKSFTLIDVAISSNELAKEYMEKDMRTIKADFEVVLNLGLAKKVGPDTYITTSEDLRMLHSSKRARIVAATAAKASKD